MRETRTLSAVRDSMELTQSKQRKYFKGKRYSLFEIGDKVMVRDYRSYRDSWIQAIIVNILGKNCYGVRIPNTNVVWKRHKNQIRKCLPIMTDIPNNELTTDAEGDNENYHHGQEVQDEVNKECPSSSTSRSHKTEGERSDMSGYSSCSPPCRRYPQRERRKPDRL